MKTIYKYPLEICNKQDIILPLGAKIIKFDIQQPEKDFHPYFPTIWAIVDTKEYRNKDRTFFLLGTGHPLPDEPIVHIGSAMTRDHKLVLHLFESEK